MFCPRQWLLNTLPLAPHYCCLLALRHGRTLSEFESWEHFRNISVTAEFLWPRHGVAAQRRSQAYAEQCASVYVTAHRSGASVVSGLPWCRSGQDTELDHLSPSESGLACVITQIDRTGIRAGLIVCFGRLLSAHRASPRLSVQLSLL